MRILYLAPLLPAPSGSGGKRAIYNHLEDMLGDAAQIDALFVDVDGVGGPGLTEFASLSARVFDRAIPTFGSGIKGKFLAIAALLGSSLPRSLAVVASRQVHNIVVSAMQNKIYDAVIIDHLNAYGMISKVRLAVPVIYVAHNVESEILKHGLEKIPPRSPWRWFARLDLARMRRVENDLLAKAARVVLIGAGDAGHPDMVKVQDKLRIWPELPAPKLQRWTNSGGKNLLFVGSAKYFPNKDAIEWLMEDLVPALLRLDPAIMLHIVGSDAADLGNSRNPTGVTFHGFVTNEQLNDLHVAANLFVCPVVLGSGIKIKLLEAAAYGVPTAATDESLAGMNFLSDFSLRINRADADAAARQIVALLANPAQLKQMSTSATEALGDEISTRISLLDHAREVIGAS